MGRLMLEGVKKSFGGVDVIRGVDLDIRDGEFVVMVGPSGCGKSTLLRLIAGLEAATAGRITIDGRDVTALEPVDRRLAMVFQSYALYPHMTVRGNMAFGLETARVPKPEIDAKVAEAARILALEPLLDRLPKQLSGGQRQRVAIGRAIVRDPVAFLFDEPLSNLDAALRVQTRHEIAKLHRSLGRTAIYVTHDQVEAMTMATHVGVLEQGRLIQFGSPREIYEDPVSISAASRLGQPKINILPADLFGHAPDGAISIGLRPEQIRQGEGEASTVRRIERLGDQTRLHLTFRGHEIITVTDPHTGLRPGDSLKIRPEKPYFFDATGQRTQ